MRAPCTVEGCDNESMGRGLCNGHYSAWWRSGRPASALTAAERFARRQFGTCCPTCPDGGRTVLYDVDDRGQIHRCIRPDHQGPRQHRDSEQVTV